MSKNVLIIGASSAIAQATARQLAYDKANFFLVARNAEKLTTLSNDLLVRGAKTVDNFQCDLTDLSQHQAILVAAKNVLSHIDIILIAHGILPDQKACEQNFAKAQQSFDVNAMSVMALATVLANELETQGSGTLAVISSVAGDRGRKSNYVYGAAKAAVSTFFEGLQFRLAEKGVNVLTIKPGFVDTPMTANMQKGGLLWAQPDAVAADIIKAINKKKRVLYTPWFWKYILFVVRLIPAPIMARLPI